MVEDEEAAKLADGNEVHKLPVWHYQVRNLLCDTHLSATFPFILSGHVV
jgi:hypothetical protein